MANKLLIKTNRKQSTNQISLLPYGKNPWQPPRQESPSPGYQQGPSDSAGDQGEAGNWGWLLIQSSNTVIFYSPGAKLSPCSQRRRARAADETPDALRWQLRCSPRLCHLLRCFHLHPGYWDECLQKRTHNASVNPSEQSVQNRVLGAPASRALPWWLGVPHVSPESQA